MYRSLPACLAALLLLLQLLFAASGLSAAEAASAAVSGIWSGIMTDRNGDPQDLSFRFVQTGNVLKGKMYGDNESLPLTGLKVTGNEITFSVTTELNGQITTFIYTGVIAGSEMEVGRIRQDAKPADLKSAVPGKAEKPAAPQTFRLKRLT